MAYRISEKCIQCGSCAPFCKNEAIQWIYPVYVIDPSKCEMCGTCREYCPIDDVIVDCETAASSEERASSSLN